VSRIPGARLDLRGAQRPAWDADPEAPPVGVLALQGDVLEHARALARVGLRPVPVRRAMDLEGLLGIVLPGGESTAISRALDRGGLTEPLGALVRSGAPVLGTCAGLILLSDELEDDAGLARPGGLAIRTRRNAYGSQAASFDVAFEVVGIEGGPMHASFIRAPRIEAVLSPDVEVLASVAGHPVAVRQGSLLAMSFHPEVSGDLRMHALLATSVHERAAR
jgi:5'-phosphate synthase pdxT subunit